MSAKLIVLFACICTASSSCNNSLEELDLHRHLFDNYNPDVIPRPDRAGPVKVDIEFYLKAIDSVDVKRQTVGVRAFLSVQWNDELLKWDKDTYPGVSNINVKNEAIWIPDISLAGSHGDILDIGQKDGRAMITNNGSVTIWPYKLFKVECTIRIAQFPWDEHECIFSFSSWTNPTTVLTLQNPSGSIDLNRRYTQSGSWDAFSLATIHHKTNFGSLHFDHVDFRIRLRRKWLFHTLNIVMPTVCISLLNILCFLLPPQSGERVTLSISIFLSLAVFLSVINGTMPESSDEVAIFNIYLCLQLIGAALTNFINVIVLCCFHKSTQVPYPIRYLTRMACMFLKGDGKQHVLHLTDKGTGREERQMSWGKHVTWALATLAADRVCLVGAIVWHVLLNLYLAIGIVQ